MTGIIRSKVRTGARVWIADRNTAEPIYTLNVMHDAGCTPYHVAANWRDSHLGDEPRLRVVVEQFAAWEDLEDGTALVEAYGETEAALWIELR